MSDFAYYNITTTDITTLTPADTLSSDYSSGPINSAAEIVGSPKSITVCNIDASGDACTIDLFISSQSSSHIADTGTNANETDNHETTSSVTLTVDGTAATTDIFANEKVYKSDGTLLGTCTARNSNTEIVFGSGISQTIADNQDLYTGARHYILNDVVIPSGSTLVLEQPELNYDSTKFDLRIKLTDVSATQIINVKVEY
jgi:hypothetical protein